MKKMRSIRTYVFLPALAASILGAGTASAHGMFGMGMDTRTPDQIATDMQAVFQNEANFLGVSVDAVKAAWAQGKDLEQLAAENGLTKDQLKAKRQAAMAQKEKERLQALVAKGAITQAQADARTAAMTAKKTAGQRKDEGPHGKGIARGRRGGMFRGF